MAVTTTSAPAAQVRRQSPEPFWRRPSLIAWLWIGPAVIIALVFLVYPVIYTIWLSLQNAYSTAFVGLANYKTVFTSPDYLTVLRNNILWIVLGTIFTVALGLVIAVLVDRVRFESIFKSAIFIPMAISFVGAGVIWRFVYAYNNPGESQIGLLNALVTRFGGQPQAWLIGGANNICADRRLRLDLDRLLHGDPLGRPQGHPGGHPRSGAQSTAPARCRSFSASSCR